jgi:hypothetical protein
MPASIDYSTLSVAQLLAVRSTIDEAIMARSSGVTPAPSSAKAGKSPKEKVKRKGSPGAWSDWTKKVMTDFDAEIKAFKEAAEQKCGAHLKWISANKGKTSAEWLAFKAEWDAAHPKEAKGKASEAEAEESDSSPEGGAVAATAPVAAEKVAKRRGPKKLVDMTASERATHDAKVAEKKAKKSAGALALEAEVKANAPIQLQIPAPPAQKVPALLTPATSVAEAKAEAEAEDDDSIELKIFTLDGQKYMRPWSSSASDWATGDLWYTNKKGEKSHYLGELMEDGTINGDAEEPTIA